MTSTGRRSGILVPLFSAPSSSSWGIGDIGDIAPLTAWLAGAGQRLLQLLPLNAMAPGTQSPYSAMSAMAIDPIYIRVTGVDEFVDLGGERALNEDDRHIIEAARQAPRIEYARIRDVKERALRASFDRFVDAEWSARSRRAAALRAYISAEAWWLEDYALFRALHDHHGGNWTEWPEPLRRRHPDALDEARDTFSTAVLLHEYLQWIAGQQWADARASAATHGVQIFGDLPFMVDLHSADVWMHQARFDLDRSVGVPPDAFSATGQDWGMPAYDWPALAAGNYGWLRDRARRSAALFDGYRVDHLVGFYRTYSRPRTGEGEAAFSPALEADQLELGEQMLAVFREPGAEIVAEDLGTVPDFVRASLKRLAVPGFRVFRWEREWDEPGQPFRDPVLYPAVSVATSGTHDTEPLATWWNNAEAEEQDAVLAIPSVQKAAAGLRAEAFIPRVRDLLIETLFASGSDLLLFPIQDVFGWSDRINEPATVHEMNWSYRLPWPIDAFDAQPEAVERQARLREWAQLHGRVAPAGG